MYSKGRDIKLHCCTFPIVEAVGNNELPVEVSNLIQG
jgi:hypothetical protein